MAANAFALHEPLGERETARWGVSAAVIVALHVAAAVLAMNWLRSQPEQGVTLPAIMIDMAPVTSAPQPTPDDVAPGPLMQAGRRLAAGGRAAAGRRGNHRADAAAGEAGGRGAAGAEAGADAGQARAREDRAGRKARAGEAEGGSPRGQEAVGCNARAAHQRAAACRARSADGIRHERRRGGLGDRILQSTRPRASDALPPISVQCWRCSAASPG